MKRFIWFSIALIFLLAGCASNGSGAECIGGICISLEVEGPVQALEPALFIVTVTTEKDVAGLGISIFGYQTITILDIEKQPDVAELAYQDERSMDWWIDTKGGEEYTITGHLMLAKPNVSYGSNSYGLFASAGHPSITRVTDSVTIYLDGVGKQVEEGSVKMLEETNILIPTPPLDLTVVPETPWPTVVWPTKTALPTPSPTLPPYP